ncbi:MAG TPA: PA0069 family radical SAM protein [Planctomycetaceae bacterium]|nr:PA0069 family radical SAM protein [Planctomycetaceae bacterium]
MTKSPRNENGDPKGRGSPLEPANRFLPVRVEADYEHFENDEEFFDELRTVPTEFLPDTSRSVISQNDSPDLPFRYSLNPYRGCEHGCAYCYARPTHEYLGLNAGIDFESKIFVKERAPELFREFLARDGWRGEFVMLSGVTDCYQPVERKFRLTRGCLEVALEARQPLSLITKNARILRDLDLLRELATRRLVQVAISITTLDESLARTMEPRTSRPAARLRAIRELTSAGVPVRAMLAPLIPGLNDHEVPALMSAVREAGARAAGYTMLRLPLAVAPVFRDWLTRTHPTHAARIEGLIRGTRSGKLYSAKFGERMRGTGLVAEQIERTFRVFARKHGLDQPLPELDSSQFVPPADRAGQRRLF